MKRRPFSGLKERIRELEYRPKHRFELQDLIWEKRWNKRVRWNTRCWKKFRKYQCKYIKTEIKDKYKLPD